MASALLHIKDSYYFEVPKSLWRVQHLDKSEFPKIWVKLDPQFQLWEAERLYDLYVEYNTDLPPQAELLDEYTDWKHDHTNEGKPFAEFLEVKYESWFADHADFSFTWRQIKSQAGNIETFQNDASARWQWSPEKLTKYNQHLSGKIIIPQYFGGKLRNLYQSESGLAISKFMIIQVIVALLLVVVFKWLAKQTERGERPQGRTWNLLEVFVVFIRDQIARPSIGGHDADRFVPLLLTLFFFVLGCNLMGMLPWMGAPTGSWGVTFALACVTFGTVMISGMIKFGPLGFILNQIPSMDLPLVLAVLIKPLILVIELLGLLIKHAVLSVRLLANMVAGHLVLLAIMMLAFSVEGAASSTWGITAVISVVGSTLFSCLELFVAFLQAYIFTFLSALFIGAAIHHH